MSWLAVPSDIKARPGDRAERDRAHRGIAAACGDDDAARQAELLGDLGRSVADRGRALDQRGAQAGAAAQAASAALDQTRRPRRAASCPAASLISAPLFAGQREAEIVLGRQHAGDSAAISGSCRAEPQHFRCREARHRLDADDARQFGKVAREFGRFRMGARVVVQDGGTHRLVGPVEQRPRRASARKSLSPSRRRPPAAPAARNRRLRRPSRRARLPVAARTSPASGLSGA